jgi:flagellar basal body-associated protein FliL
MYEFSEKEVRIKFKKTEYGKKTNKMLYISLIIALVFFIASCIAFFLMGAGSEILSTTEDMWLNILFGLTAIAVIIACYFDGKRDGAIEQFKISIKKSQKK